MHQTLFIFIWFDYIWLDNTISKNNNVICVKNTILQYFVQLFGLQQTLSHYWRLIIIKNKKRQMHKFFTNLPKKTQQGTQNMDIQPPQRQSTVPWVQKYRPSCLDQLSYQTQVTSALKNIVKTGNIPHLLFYGPAGTGKTSAIIAMAREIFGDSFYRERIIQLNASDQRGINVIREKVKTFAQKIYKKNPDKTSTSPKTKIIILDEADLLTNDAQSALRRIIEDYSANTRFCIICNYITKIIEPLSSRCIKFRFKAIPSDVQYQKLQQICLKQNVKLDRNKISLLVEKGDLRQSINSLQSLSKINNISDYILPVSNQYCQSLFHKIMGCTTMKQVFQIADQIKYEGFAADEIISGLFNVVLKLPEDKTQAILLQSLGRAGEQLELGVCQLQFADLFTSMYYVMYRES